MGGAGGGFFPGYTDAEELARKTRQAEQAEQAGVFETTVAGLLAAELAAFNDRDVEQTRTVFDAVKHDLVEEIEGSVELLFGGSISKHTYVDGLSDVDALLLMDRREYGSRPPSNVRELLAECLRARYGAGAVDVGILAVTLEHQGQKIQLLPALRDGEKFKIASYGGDRWSSVNPQRFATALTDANRNLDAKLVPCIKLAKAAIGRLPEPRRLSGYHTEALAIRAFRNYDGPKTPKAMLRHFFEQAQHDVRRPIRDTSGQSVHVDEYLGDTDSIRRRIVADAIGRIARRIRNADGARSLEGWRELFG